MLEATRSSGDDLAFAVAVARLREQSVPRLARAAFDEHLERVRAASLAGDPAKRLHFDALLADAAPAFLAPRPAPLAALEDEVLGAAAARLRALWGDETRPRGERALAAGRVADQLRRLGYLGLASRADAAPTARAVARAFAGAGDDAGDRYRHALGLALLTPGEARYQAALFELRFLQ